MSTARYRAGHAGLVALVLVGLAMLGGLPAGAGPRGARPRPAQAEPEIELLAQPSWVRAGEPYTATVDVTGAPPGAQLDMVVHDLIESRAAFRDTLTGELGGTEHRVAAQPLDALSTAPGVAQIGFTPGTAGTGLPSRGAYPVEVRLRSADDDATLASTVTYLSYLTDTDEFPPLEVGVIVDIGAPPALQPDGSTDLAGESVTLARQRILAAEAAGATPLTLAPLPETVEGLVHGDDGDAALVDQLRELAATDEVLARPFVDVDLASLRSAGLLDSEANAQAEAGADVARSRLAVEPAGGVWMSGPTWGAEGAQLAVDLGFDRAIVPPTAIGDGEDEEVPTNPVRLADDGPLTMVSDPDLARHLTSGDGAVAAHRFIAELTTTWIEEPSLPRGVVVHIPQDGDIEPQVVGTALAALSDGGVVQGVPVTQIFAEVPPAEDGPTTVDVAPAENGPDLRPVAPEIESVRSRVAGVAGLLGDPDVTASVEHSLLLSTGTATPDRDRPAYVARADAALGTVTGAVTLPDEFRITLTTRSSTIPIRLTNNADRNLQVRVELESAQLEFPDGDVFTPTLSPGTTSIEVRVRTRTSGAFTLDVTVASPDDTIVLDRSTFDIRSTAISGVGLVLSVGAGLFLAVWWGRHWFRSRRDRSERPAEPPRPDPSGDDRWAPEPPEPARPERARSGALAPWAVPASPRAPAPPPPPPESDAGPGAPSARARSEESYRPAHMARSRSRGSSRSAPAARDRRH